jgi:hypothetical protein
MFLPRLNSRWVRARRRPVRGAAWTAEVVRAQCAFPPMKGWRPAAVVWIRYFLML